MARFSTKSSYHLIFGRTPDLSWAEVQSVAALLFPRGIARVHEGVAQTHDIDSSLVMKRLGGIVRIAKLVGRVSTIERVVSSIVNVIIAHKLQKIGLGCLGPVDVGSLARKLREHSATPCAYTATHPGLLTSAAAQGLLKSGAEFIVVNQGDSFSIARTCAVQDIAGWSQRDYGRPSADHKSGMLPPKVARMMINIAIGSRDPKSAILFDPFCGSGTILAEALMIGCASLGSDQDPKAVMAASKNLAWLQSVHKNALPEFSVVQSSATNLSKKLPADPNVIVTEPYLGPPNLSNIPHGRIMRVIDGIRRMYIGFLREVRRSLPCVESICLVVPVMKDSVGREHTFSLVDICEKVGYSPAMGPILYARPGAYVQRHIFLIRRRHE